MSLWTSYRKTKAYADKEKRKVHETYLHLISTLNCTNCTALFYFFPEWLSNFTSNLTAKANSSVAVTVLCKGLLFCFYLDTETLFHTGFITSTDGDGILLMSRRSGPFKTYNNINSNTPSEGSLSRKETKSKTEPKNSNLLMGLGFSVNIKVTKII